MVLPLFQVGDLIRIKSKTLLKPDLANGQRNGLNFPHAMFKQAGRIGTVVRVHSSTRYISYTLRLHETPTDSDPYQEGWYWHQEWIERYATSRVGNTFIGDI